MTLFSDKLLYCGSNLVAAVSHLNSYHFKSRGKGQFFFSLSQEPLSRFYCVLLVVVERISLLGHIRDEAKVICATALAELGQ